jgi:predicted ATPase with chaperone activity
MLRKQCSANVQQMNLSARAYHRVLKLARTTLAPAAQA